MFQQALQDTLAHEGYYANHAADKGGETYRGIARNFHPDWKGWPIIDNEKAKYGGALKLNQRVNNPYLDGYVEQFYKTKFWDAIYLDLVIDPNMQTIIFDAYVNSGSNGIKLLQKTLNEKFGKNLTVDGMQGPKTVNAINSVNAAQLFNAFKQARTDYYVAIATGSNAIFLPGWLNRIGAFSYTTVGISLAGLVVLGVAGFFL